MATNRVDMLKQMLSENPGNTFARYGLAMELTKSGDFAAAITEFNHLLEHDDSYAAAYYHGGQAYEKLGQVEEARRMYEKGIEVTVRNGDGHTRAELEAALSLLPV
ncbi:MAG: tetratricopeptide repeat protein [Bryobacteraceae bacterium]